LIRDEGSKALYLCVHPSGAKSWLMRFRLGAKTQVLTLGPLYDPDKKKARDGDERRDGDDADTGELKGDPVIGAPQTLSSARRLAAQVLHTRALGRDPAAENRASKLRQREAKQQRETSSFGACVEQFIREHRVKRRNTRPRRWFETARVLGLSYPSADCDPEKCKPEIVRDSLAARWADKPVSDIDEADVVIALDEAEKVAIPGTAPRRAGISESRKRMLHAALSTFFKWAKAKRSGKTKTERLIKTSPMRELDRPEVPTSRERVLTPSEIRWFWRACNSAGEPYRAIFRALLLTGCRLREIAELRREEISEDGATLNLPSTRTTNARLFQLPLSPAAQELVREVAARTKTPTGWTLPKRYLDRAMLAEAKRERGDDVVIPHWVLHDLRRTAATGMAELGIPPHIVEAALNHVSGAKAGVAGTYNRALYTEEKRAALERWAAHVESLVSDKPTNVTPIRRKKGA
jgi:integrase